METATCDDCENCKAIKMVIVAVVNLLNSGEPSQQMRIWCTLDKSIGGDDDKEDSFENDDEKICFLRRG